MHGARAMHHVNSHTSTLIIIHPDQRACELLCHFTTASTFLRGAAAGPVCLHHRLQHAGAVLGQNIRGGLSPFFDYPPFPSPPSSLSLPLEVGPLKYS